VSIDFCLVQFNHNADFLNDMVKDSPVGIYRCTLDYRNSFEPIDILVRHQANIMHVYADKRDSHGFQFCLSVHTNIPEFDRSGKLHMAFTALTGQCMSRFYSMFWPRFFAYFHVLIWFCSGRCS
jgi:hypothetical protein